jgi:hypothetical protein
MTEEPAAAKGSKIDLTEHSGINTKHTVSQNDKHIGQSNGFNRFGLYSVCLV